MFWLCVFEYLYICYYGGGVICVVENVDLEIMGKFEVRDVNLEVLNVWVYL